MHHLPRRLLQPSLLALLLVPETCRSQPEVPLTVLQQLVGAVAFERYCGTSRCSPILVDRAVRQSRAEALAGPMAARDVTLHFAMLPDDSLIVGDRVVRLVDGAPDSTRHDDFVRAIAYTRGEARGDSLSLGIEISGGGARVGGTIWLSVSAIAKRQGGTWAVSDVTVVAH